MHDNPVRPIPPRVLHVIGAMDRGGAETLIMNVYRTMNRDVLQFDFLVHESRECDYDREIRELGGRIYHVERFTGLNCHKYNKAIRSFFEQHHGYGAVHVHIGSCAPIVISAAKAFGIPTIAHSHNTNSPDWISEIPFRIVSYPTRYLADYYLACSEQAGLDRFGSKVARGSSFKVLKNGIDTASFTFSSQVRDSVRESLGYSPDDYVFGNVGRLTSQKNQGFLLEAFSKARVTNPSLKLLLVGRGEDERELRNQCERLALADSVRFLGVSNDVPSLMMAMDCFVFPSKWEGFGIVALEAQAAGLPCILSAQLPELVTVSGGVERLPVDSGTEMWTKALLEMSKRDYRDLRESGAKAVKDAGFDIKDVAAELTNLYFALARNG